jgi:hypothetical protein
MPRREWRDADAVTNLRLLTRDTVPAHRLGDYLAHDWRATPAVRAAWSVAFGPVTQVLFLQDFAGELPALPEGPDGVPLEQRERELLLEMSPLVTPPAGIRVFELRSYDVRIGHGARFLELMLAALPIRTRHSPNFGVWTSATGRLERVMHLWGYRDLDERNAVRAALKDDAAWGEYTATILPMLAVLNSHILTPLPL